METTIVYWGYIEDNEKESRNYYSRNTPMARPGSPNTLSNGDPRLINPLLFKGLHIRIFIVISITWRGFINQGSGLGGF